MKVLTAQQQELVVRHMGLVRMHVRRQLCRLAPQIAEREHADMFQEGLIGLMEAASRYRPEAGKPFAGYALPYIRGAVCRHLTGQMDGLAIPEKVLKRIVSQRQDRPQGGANADSQVPVLPQFFELEASLSLVARQIWRQYQRRQAAESEDRPGASDRAGDSSQLLWDRYERAVHWAAGRLKAAPCRKPDRPAIVEAFVQERLLVLDERYRTSRRSLARRFACSLSRLQQCERRLLALVRQHLEGGAVRRASCVQVIGRPAGVALKPADATTCAAAPSPAGSH